MVLPLPRCVASFSVPTAGTAADDDLLALRPITAKGLSRLARVRL
jgi:hypothetical protein